MAAAGVGLVLAGGVGGFAIGHAIDGTEASDPGTVTDSAPTASRTGRTVRGGRPDFDRDGTVQARCRPARGRSAPAPTTAARRERHDLPVAPRPAGAGGPPVHRHRRDSAVRLVAVLLLWTSLLLVTYWWVTGGGVQDLGGWDTGLTSVGRLTGLLASDLLLVQVLLMARVPVLERAFGQDRLARLHRVVGFTSFNLMLAHIVLITWGYAAGELSAHAGDAVGADRRLPGHAAGRAGTVCLVMVVVTSVRAARRRLRYESWHLLHLYAYLGVGLALPHQLWTGQEFLASPAATVFWWGAVGGRGRRRAGLAGRRCRCGAARGTGCGSRPSSPRATASCRST